MSGPLWMVTIVDLNGIEHQTEVGCATAERAAELAVLCEPGTGWRVVSVVALAAAVGKEET